jgi:hypothetical protein
MSAAATHCGSVLILHSFWPQKSYRKHCSARYSVLVWESLQTNKQQTANSSRHFRKHGASNVTGSTAERGTASWCASPCTRKCKVGNLLIVFVGHRSRTGSTAELQSDVKRVCV